MNIAGTDKLPQWSSDYLTSTLLQGSLDSALHLQSQQSSMDDGRDIKGLSAVPQWPCPWQKDTDTQHWTIPFWCEVVKHLLLPPHPPHQILLLKEHYRQLLVTQLLGSTEAMKGVVISILDTLTTICWAWDAIIGFICSDHLFNLHEPDNEEDGVPLWQFSWQFTSGRRSKISNTLTFSCNPNTATLTDTEIIPIVQKPSSPDSMMMWMTLRSLKQTLPNL